jgi:hypothetical protein
MVPSLLLLPIEDWLRLSVGTAAVASDEASSPALFRSVGPGDALPPPFLVVLADLAARFSLRRPGGDSDLAPTTGDDGGDGEEHADDDDEEEDEDDDDKVVRRREGSSAGVERDEGDVGDGRPLARWSPSRSVLVSASLGVAAAAAWLFS